MAIRKVNSRSIGVDVITAEDLAANSVTVSEISDGAVSDAKLATNSVTTDKVANGALTPVKLSAGAPTWTSGGLLGVGTASPSTTFDVDASYSAGIRVRQLYTYSGANYAMAVVGDGSNAGYISQNPASGGLALADGMRYYGGGPWVPDATTAGSIQLTVGNIVFNTNSGLTAGTNFTPTERMRIQPTGNVAIGANLTTPTTATKLALAGGIYHRGSYSGSLSSGGNFIFNLLSHTGTTFCGGTIKVFGTENQINQTFAEYDFILARYVWDGTGYINYQIRLIERKRVSLNNGYGNVYIYLSNYAASYTTSDQTGSSGGSGGTGSTSVYDIYARNAVGQACGYSIVVDFTTW